jgi:hypothetical protein
LSAGGSSAAGDLHEQRQCQRHHQFSASFAIVILLNVNRSYRSSDPFHSGNFFREKGGSHPA